MKEFTQYFKSTQNISAGSTELLDLLQEEILDYCLLKSISFSEIEIVLHWLSKEFGSFAVIQHYIIFLHDNLVIKQKEPVNELLRAYTLNYIDKWKHLEKKLLRSFLRSSASDAKSVLLHSNSKSVSGTLCLAFNQGFSVQVYQTESCPALEGRIQATRLKKCGFNVSLISDTSMGSFLKKSEAVLLGADCISEDYFINKSGSLLIAELCRSYSIPLYIISDSRKIVSRNLASADFTSASSRIWDYISSPLNVKMDDFEKVPLSFVREIISD
jgi:translation initiation factor 2B subunit (eIF-2B alpha/beta/delta family)